MQDSDASYPPIQVVPAGESAIMVMVDGAMNQATQNAIVRIVYTTLQAKWPLTNWVIAYASALGKLDAIRDSARSVAAELEHWLNSIMTHPQQRLDMPQQQRKRVAIPVCYEPSHAPDLALLSDLLHLPEETIVRLHRETTYQVAMIGFKPGFPYLLGLPDALIAPRRAMPRLKVEAGSVGIGGRQTGIYPQATAGGWNLIGRTPLELFNPQRSPMSLLEVGNLVEFEPISDTEFQRIRTTVTGMELTPQPALRTGERWIDVRSPGLLTTVQDRGRVGHEHLGVSPSGPMDWISAAMANALVNNHPNAALLECTLRGPSLQFHGDAQVAITGANVDVKMNGQEVPLWTTVFVPSGAVLTCGGCREGCRAYIAVDGGIDVPPVMGSRCTSVAEHIGGTHGRALVAGDRLSLADGNQARHASRARSIPWHLRPVFPDSIEVHLLPASSRAAVSVDTRHSFIATEWSVSTKSDRMGIQLTRATAAVNLIPDGTRSAPDARTGLSSDGALVVSEPVLPGTIQWPPLGDPITLMAEAQTIGGYPVVGIIPVAELPMMAQARPGTSVRFALGTEDEARLLLKEKMTALKWWFHYL